MFASLARTASLALVAVALHGCIGPDDQQLLLEDGSDEAPWTTCTNEAMVLEGQNGDACTFDGPMGESCSHREDPIAADFTSNTCLDGRLLKGAAIVIASSYPEGRCLEPNVFDSYGMGFDVQTSTGGCLEVARCMWPDHDSLWQLCPAPVAEGVRPDAAGVAAWWP